MSSQVVEPRHDASTSGKVSPGSPSGEMADSRPARCLIMTIATSFDRTGRWGAALLTALTAAGAMSWTEENRFSGLLTNSPFGPRHAERAGIPGLFQHRLDHALQPRLKGAGGQVRSVWLELVEPEGILWCGLLTTRRNPCRLITAAKATTLRSRLSGCSSCHRCQFRGCRPG